MNERIDPREPFLHNIPFEYGWPEWSLCQCEVGIVCDYCRYSDDLEMEYGNALLLETALDKIPCLE